VWKEWTEPDCFAAWFGGGEAKVPVPSASMDVRKGGRWRATMFAGPGHREIHWKGEYREVVEPERLVFTLSDQPGDDAYELVTVVLTDLGDGRTEMRFNQRGSLSPEEYGGGQPIHAVPAPRLIPQAARPPPSPPTERLPSTDHALQRDHVERPASWGVASTIPPPTPSELHAARLTKLHRLPRSAQAATVEEPRNVRRVVARRRRPCC
jgi:hypothetical protein